MSQSSSKPISVGVVGFGTVGSGVVKILIENKDLISQRVGREVVVSKVRISISRGIGAWRFRRIS